MSKLSYLGDGRYVCLLSKRDARILRQGPHSDQSLRQVAVKLAEAAVSVWQGPYAALRSGAALDQRQGIGLSQWTSKP